jgi:hypothetical protein
MKTFAVRLWQQGRRGSAELELYASGALAAAQAALAALELLLPDAEPALVQEGLWCARWPSLSGCSSRGDVWTAGPWHS